MEIPIVKEKLTANMFVFLFEIRFLIGRTTMSHYVFVKDSVKPFQKLCERETVKQYPIASAKEFVRSCQ